MRTPLRKLHQADDGRCVLWRDWDVIIFLFSGFTCSYAFICSSAFSSSSTSGFASGFAFGFGRGTQRAHELGVEGFVSRRWDDGGMGSSGEGGAAVIVVVYGG